MDEQKNKDLDSSTATEHADEIMADTPKTELQGETDNILAGETEMEATKMALPEADLDIGKELMPKKKVTQKLVKWLVGLLMIAVLAAITVFLLRPKTLAVKYDTDGSVLNEAPLMYFTPDSTVEGGGILHITGRGMEQEAVFTQARLHPQTEFLPIISSHTGNKVAYVSAERDLYEYPVKALAGTANNNTEYMVEKEIAEVIDYTPDGTLLFYLDGEMQLKVYDGKQSMLVDTSPFIQPRTDGSSGFSAMQNNRIVYIRREGETVQLATMHIGVDTAPVIIGDTPAYSISSDHAEGMVYYLDENPPGMKEDPERDISGYYYDFKAGTSTLLSKKFAQVLWGDSKGKLVFIEVNYNQALPQGFSINICYFADGQVTVLGEDVQNKYHVSNNQQFVIYEQLQPSGNIIYTFQSLQKQDGVLPEPQVIFDLPQTEYASFTSSKTEDELFVLRFAIPDETPPEVPAEEDLVEDTTVGEETLTEDAYAQVEATNEAPYETKEEKRYISYYTIHVGAEKDSSDVVLSSPRLVDDKIESVLYNQADGQLVYLKDSSSDGRYANLYIYKDGAEQQILENVWLASLGGMPADLLEQNEVLAVTVDDPTQPGIPTGKLVRYKDGEASVLLEAFPANGAGQPLPVTYRNSNLIYAMKFNGTSETGDLYRIIDGKPAELIATNVTSSF